MNARAGTDPRPGLLQASEEARCPRPPDMRSGRAGRRADDVHPRAAPSPFSDTQFFRRAVLVCSLVVATTLLLALIWFAGGVLLLLFAGILLAVLLRAPTNWLARHTPLSENFALMLSMLAMVALFGLLIYLFAVPLANQVGQLVETLPQAMARLRQWMLQYHWTRALLPLAGELSRIRLDIEMLGHAGGVISSALESVVGIVVVLFIGGYLAAQPRLYQRGFMHLLSPKARGRAAHVLDEVGGVLRWWLLGRMVTMIVVGAAAGLGLWWLDVPLAFTLAILSGFLEFIPYFGPILSAVPPLLIAFNVDPAQAFYVLLLYVAIQSAEGYLLSPLIEQRTVSLPPALVIVVTLLMGAMAGPLGVILASPLTASCIVAIKRLYVEDVVEQQPAARK